MEEVKIIDLEDGSYIISDEIILNNTKYIYLTKENDMMNFCIRKIVMENGEEFIDALDTEEEFDRAMQVFLQKHKQDLENFN